MTIVSGGIVRVPKAGEMVAASIRRQIIIGDLKEGDVLPSEAVLMEQFGVSRPTLREAYRILEAESIISVRRGSRGGARVLVPDGRVAAHYAGLVLQHRGALLSEVYETRALLESAAVGELALRRTVSDLKALDAALADASDAIGDAVLFAEKDARFHRLVTELVGNQTIDMLVGMLYEIIESHNRTYLATHDHAQEGGAQKVAQKAHAKLISLIRERNSEAAQAFWRKHLVEVEHHMIEDPATTVLEIVS